MELKRAKGNTWYLEDWQLIPLYRVDEHRCILLDAGMADQCHAMEECLRAAGLTPIGILCSHAHNDHSSNCRYFQQTYRIPVAMSMGEAAICCTEENLKAYYFMSSLEEFRANERVNQMQVRADQIIWPEDEMCSFCGVEFGIVHTPGHSPDHICVRTPDDVLYLADALLTGEALTAAKLPFHLIFRQAIQSMELLKEQPASLYLAAHRGVYEDLGGIIEDNIARIRDRAERIAALVDEPIHLSELNLRVCRAFGLHSPTKGAVDLYERNVRAYLEYLKDEGMVEPITRDGIFYYTAK